MDLSIVVPVYNVERFLTRCLDSIFSQRFPGELEVIGVDDGSVDGSLELLRDYAAQEPRLVVLTHKNNRKLSAARASGMKAAKGCYIMHVDSDDWLLPGSLASLFQRLQSEKPDVIMFNYVRAGPDRVERVVEEVETEKFGPMQPDLLPHFFKSCWAKVVRRELTGGMVYYNQSLNRGEDLILGVEIFLRAKNVLCLPDVYYAYFMNPDSITKTGTEREWFTTRVPVLEAMTALRQRYGAGDGVIDAAVHFQMRIIHKKLALYRLNAPPVVDWAEMAEVLDRLDERGLLSRQVVNADKSFVSRVLNVYRYLGLRWSTSYVINGVLLPRIGRGWQLPASNL